MITTTAMASLRLGRRSDGRRPEREPPSARSARFDGPRSRQRRRRSYVVEVLVPAGRLRTIGHLLWIPPFRLSVRTGMNRPYVCTTDKLHTDRTTCRTAGAGTAPVKIQNLWVLQNFSNT